MGGRLPETTGTAANRKCFVRKHIPRHRPVTGNYRYSNYSTHASDAGPCGIEGIWQCVTATKKGKKFCPDSKGIAEETIEQAFIESYRLLRQNNKDVLDEFIARTEETLSDSNASKQLAKVEKDIAALDAKRAKLVDMRLEENEVLDTFDRYVFESIVEKVIVGGYDEDGNKDPSMLTFIYKTGFRNSLDGTNFKPPRKNSKAAKQNAGLCSHTTDEAKSMCSYHSDDTCGDGSTAETNGKRLRETFGRGERWNRRLCRKGEEGWLYAVSNLNITWTL